MADFTEAQVYETFGLTAPAEPEQTTGEQAGADIAGTAGTSTSSQRAAGDTDREQTSKAFASGEDEPQNMGADVETGGGDRVERARTNAGTAEKSTDDEPTEASGTESEAQTPEERRENAARRRRAEQQAAIDRAVEDALKAEREKMTGQWTDFFQKANLKNTLTGNAITTLDEFNEWNSAFEQAKLERDLKAGKLTPEVLNQAISQNPAVKRAEELIRRDEQQRQQTADSAAKARIDAEIAEIHGMDPAINSIDDLLNMPNGKQFAEYVRRGNTFIDAYYLANRTAITEKTAQAARQQAAGNARSKEHLTAAGNVRGAGAASVPAEEMAMFRLFNPEASEADIQAYYNKTKK